MIINNNVEYCVCDDIRSRIHNPIHNLFYGERKNPITREDGIFNEDPWLHVQDRIADGICK